MNTTIENYGFCPTTLPEKPAGIPARVTAVHRGLFEVVCDKGGGLARLKTAAYRPGGEAYPTVGDFVLLDWRTDGESRILRTLPRRTCFTRLSTASGGRREQVAAANFDYVFILQAFGPDFNLRRLERYLTLSRQSGAVPAVLLNKADCCTDTCGQLHAAKQISGDVKVFAVSAKTGQGLEQLSAYLQPGRTAVLLGPSGVGKSTLVNTLAGQPVAATGEVRARDRRGRHTTCSRQLILLESGAMVIDTPGMRELGMWEANTGLEQSFAEVERLSGQCKFNNCRHQGEPGCAVAAAMERGELSRERWESYQKLSAEMDFSDGKSEYPCGKNRRPQESAKRRRNGTSPDYRIDTCAESFVCKVCGAPVGPENAGSRHRNHCPHCLSSIHADNRPGDRAALCKGIMDPIGVWVRRDGEWAIIHRCRTCGALSSNRIAADDNQLLLMSIALRPLAAPPFPLAHLTEQDK